VAVGLCLGCPLLGCATLSVTQHTRDFLQPVGFERAVVRDDRVVVVYEVGVLRLEDTPVAVTRAWATLDLQRVKWVALGELPDAPFPLVDSPLPATHLSSGEGAIPELPASPGTLDVPLIEIPRDEQTPSARQRAYFRRVAGEHPRALLTVSRLGWPTRLFLVKQGDNGDGMVARVQPPVESTVRPSGVAMRALLYPPAVAYDLATAPVQAVMWAVSQLGDR